MPEAFVSHTAERMRGQGRTATEFRGVSAITLLSQKTMITFRELSHGEDHGIEPVHDGSPRPQCRRVLLANTCLGVL